MANIAKWNAPAAYATAGFTVTDFNSLASGNVVVATTAVANQTNLDLMANVSFSLVVGGTTTASSSLALFWLPLNQDGTTYGDGAATGTVAPAASYLVAAVGVKSGVASGSAVVGTFPAFVLLPRAGKLVILSNLGIALNAAAAAAVQISAFNENLNG